MQHHENCAAQRWPSGFLAELAGRPLGARGLLLPFAHSNSPGRVLRIQTSLCWDLAHLVPKRVAHRPVPKIWAEAKDIRTCCAINVFYSWAQSSLRMLCYGSLHPSYALAVDKLNPTMQVVCRQEWALDHLWPCSFSTEVPKYWNWGICTGNLAVQTLHGKPMGQCITVFFYISSATGLL